jgi:hypothetical protein
MQRTVQAFFPILRVQPSAAARRANTLYPANRFFHKGHPEIFPKESYQEFIDAGKKLLSEGNAQEAVQLFKNAILANPEKDEAKELYGQAVLKTGTPVYSSPVPKA